MRIWILLIAMAIMISGCEVADSTKGENAQVEVDKLVTDTVSEPEPESSATEVEPEPSVTEVEKEAVSEAVEAEPEAENLMKVETVKVEPAISEPMKDVAVEKATEPDKVEPAVAVAEISPEDVVVTVNGVEITEGQVAAKIEERMKMQATRMAASGREMSVDEMDKMKTRLRPSVVDMMVEERILRQKMEAKGVEVSEEDVDTRIAEMAEQRGVALEDVEGELAKSGMTMEGLRSQLKMGLGVQKLVDLEIGSEATVTEEDARKYYDGNPKRFSTPDQVKASHILIKTEKLDDAGKEQAKQKMADLLKQVKEGADFAELAKANSECSSSKKGGDLGFFARERMVKEFSDAAFSMQEGDISDIVESKFGYHIIKVTGKKEAATTSYEEAKEGIVSNLERKNKGGFWRKYRADIKSEAEIVWSEKEKAAREAAAKNRPGPPPRVAPAPTQNK